MSDKLAKALLRKDKKAVVSEEQDVGAHFDGESLRERIRGRQREIMVNIYQRPNKTLFLRVIVPNPVRDNMATRFETDLDRYTNETDFLKAVMIGAGAAAEDQNEKWAAGWDPAYVAEQARQAAHELFHEAQDPDNL